MTREEKIAAVVANINKSLDVPVLGEAFEGKVIAWAVNRVAPSLPDSVLDAVLSASDGIDESEIETLKAAAVDAAAKASPLNDAVDRIVFRPVVDYLFDCARAGLTVVAE